MMKHEANVDGNLCFVRSVESEPPRMKIYNHSIYLASLVEHDVDLRESVLI
jgi:hypothetical protein